MSETGGPREHGPHNPEERETTLPKRWAAVSIPREDMRWFRDNAQTAARTDTGARLIETKFMAQDALIPQGRETGLKGGGDAVLYVPELGLYAVFDGISTQTDTDVGIQMAQEIITREIRSLPLEETDPDVIRIAVEQAVQVAEQALREEARRREAAGENPLGRSTIALALVRNDNLFYTGKGDSPVRLFRPHAAEGQRLKRLTTYQDLTNKLFSGAPDVVTKIQDIFDGIHSRDEIPPDITIPRPSVTLLEEARASAQRSGQRQAEAAIGNILQIVAANGDPLPPRESAFVIWQLTQARATIHGALGSGKTAVGVERIGPDDVVVLESDAFATLTTAENEELLETEDQPRSFISASVRKVVQQLAAGDWRGRGDDTTREVIKRRTAIDALLDYTTQITALTTKLSPLPNTFDPIQHLRTIEDNRQTRPYEAVRAARILLDELLVLKKGSVEKSDPIETYRQITETMTREGWRGISSAIAERPRSLPTDGFAVVACIDNPTDVGDSQLYFFRRAATLVGLPTQLPQLPADTVATLSGYAVHERIFIDASARQNHQTETVPLVLEGDAWRVDHSSPAFRKYLPIFHENNWFHIESVALGQWLKFAEIGEYEGDFVVVQLVQLEDGTPYYFCKLTNEEPAQLIDIKGQPANKVNTASFAITPEIIEDIRGVERPRNSLNRVERDPQGEIHIQDQEDRQYREILQPFFRNGWRVVSPNIVRDWEANRTSRSFFDPAFLTVAHVAVPGYGEYFFAANAPTVNPRPPRLPEGTTVDMRFYRRLRQISSESELVGHLEPVRQREEPLEPTDQGSTMEYINQNEERRFELELESLLNDHYSAWMRCPETLVRSWESTHRTSFNYNELRQRGVPLQRLTILAVENPHDPDNPLFFVSFRAHTEDLGLPTHLDARATAYQIEHEENTGLITLIPEETFVSRAQAQDIENIPPGRVSRETPPIREREYVPPPHIPTESGPLAPEPPTPPQEPKKSFFRSKWGRRISRGLSVVAGVLGLNAERGDAGSFESPTKPQAVIEDVYTPSEEDAGYPADSAVSDALPTQPDAAREISQPEPYTPEPPEQEALPEQPQEKQKTAEIEELKHNIVTVLPFEPGIQVAVTRALKEQGIPQGVALKTVHEAARFRHDTKNALSNRVFAGDKIHFASYIENGQLKIRIGDVDHIEHPEAKSGPSPEIKKEWHDGETFHIGSGSQLREFTVGDSVYYTPKSGVQSEYVVLSPSLDKDPGIILQIPGTKKQFALTRTAAERVVKKNDLDTTYTEDWMAVADEEEQAHVDAKGNTLLGKRRVIFTSPDGEPTGKGLIQALKHLIAKERNMSVDEATPEALVAIRNADMKGDPDVFLLGQGFLYDLDKEELTIIR